MLGAAAGVLGLLLLAWALEDEDGTLDEPIASAMPQTQPVDAAAPDISGLWRTASGEVYRFEQNGRLVQMVSEVGGQRVGEGQGQFDGQLLRLAVAMSVNGMMLGNVNCDMHPAPDQRSYTGMCVGPSGTFPAQFFR
jgi:hypothetical protein